MYIISNTDTLIRVRQEQLNDARRAAAQQRLVKRARLQSPNVWARLAQLFEMTRTKFSRSYAPARLNVTPNPEDF